MIFATLLHLRVVGGRRLLRLNEFLHAKIAALVSKLEAFLSIFSLRNSYPSLVLRRVGNLLSLQVLV